MELDTFVELEAARLKAFSDWYKDQNKQDPENYPLSLPSDNAGAWDEMLADFGSSS